MHVTDLQNESHSFTMVAKEGKYQIIDATKVADWIKAVEKKLENAIIENLFHKTKDWSS